MSVIPVSTIQTIPAYATQTVPIYNNAIAPSLNYGASAPLLSNTTNYGTTSVPSSFIQVPVTNPVKPTESVISLAHSQLSIPTTPSIIPTAPLYTQPRGGLRPLLFHASNIPLSAVQIRPNYVNIIQLMKMIQEDFLDIAYLLFLWSEITMLLEQEHKLLKFVKSCLNKNLECILLLLINNYY